MAPLFLNAQAQNQEKRWSYLSMRKAWMTAAATVGVDARLYEGTKHSLGTALVAQGVSIDSVRKVMGHADVRTTELYAKLGDDAVVRALRRPMWHRVGTPAKPPEKSE